REAAPSGILERQTVALAMRSGTIEEAIPAGTVLTKEMLAETSFAHLDLKTFRVENKKSNERAREIIDAADEIKARVEEKAEQRIDQILQPDELPPGVI